MSDLDNIKVGDKVAVLIGNKLNRIETITRTTSKQVAFPGVGAGTERVFWRKNGREVGAASDRGVSWGRDTEMTVRAACDRDVARLALRDRRRAAIEILERIVWHAVDVDTLEEMVVRLRNVGATRE